MDNFGVQDRAIKMVADFAKRMEMAGMNTFLCFIVIV